MRKLDVKSDDQSYVVMKGARFLYCHENNDFDKQGERLELCLENKRIAELEL